MSVKCLAHRIDSRNAIPFSGQMFSEHVLWAGLHSKHWMPIWVRQKEFCLSKCLPSMTITQRFSLTFVHILFFSSSLHVHCSVKTNLVPGPGSEESETDQMYTDPQFVI